MGAEAIAFVSPLGGGNGLTRFEQPPPQFGFAPLTVGGIGSGIGNRRHLREQRNLMAMFPDCPNL
jgi:hypothetical protein